ncbi:MAG: recombinase family protein, partial [Planctomycetota bacterium]
MKNGKHTAIYIRVSSNGQDHASQLPDLEHWAENHNGPVQWYRDKYTGKTMDRPGMQKLGLALRTGKLKSIVVWRLDRLGRTAKGLCQFFDELRDYHVDLVS